MEKQESTISQKRISKGLIESLSFRVFVISIILLVIPLLLHNFILYHHDYLHRKKDVFSALQLLGESRSFLIDKMIEDQSSFLKEVVIGFQFENEPKEQFFERLKGKIGHVELSYYSFGADKTLICRASTFSGIVGEDISQHHEAFVEAMQSRESTFVYRSKTTGDFWINVSMTHYAEDGVTPIGLWTAGSPAIYFVEKVRGKKNFSYPIDMAIVSKDMQIITSTRPELIGQFIDTGTQNKDADLQLISVKGMQDSYELRSKKTQVNSYATLVPMVKWNLNLLMEVKKSFVTSVSLKNYLYRIISLLFFVVVIGGTGCIWLINRIAKPMRSLCQSMETIAQGDMQARYKDDKMGFEINVLGHHFNHMVESLIRHQKMLQVERTQKQAFEQELKIGHNIQKSMLPAHLPDYPGLDLATGYLPAKEVGGDFYDLFTTPDNRLMIAIADTSGKGISACMYSLNIRSMIRAYFSYGLPMKEVIKNTNQLFAKDAENTGIFVTAWFGLYDKNTQTLEYTSSGHYPAFLRKENGELLELNTKGIALGVENVPTIETQKIQLATHDILFLYTDGVIDAINPSDEFFGTKRLKELIQRSGNLPSKQIVKSLLNEIKSFSEMTAQFDDITVVSIRVT